MSQGQFRKYLGYALGEVVLIVVGILIALQISNANEERQERIRERQSMQALLADLHEDIENFDIAIDGNSGLLEELNTLLALITEVPQNDEEQRKLYLHSIKSTYWYVTVEFSEGTISQMNYSGDIRLIRDRTVADGILKYIRGKAACDYIYEELRGYFHVVEESQKDLLNLGLAKKAFEFIEQDYMNMLLPVERIEDLVEQGQYFSDTNPKALRDYYGDVLFYRTTLNNITLLLRRQKELALELSAVIQESYGFD